MRKPLPLAPLLLATAQLNAQRQAERRAEPLAPTDSLATEPTQDQAHAEDMDAGDQEINDGEEDADAREQEMDAGEQDADAGRIVFAYRGGLRVRLRYIKTRLVRRDGRLHRLRLYRRC